MARPLVIFGAFVLVVATLYARRPILVPVALVMLLAFLLSPVVAALERRVGRAIAVTLVVVIAFSLLGGLGWAVSYQVTSLADELPKYRANIMRRGATVRGAAKVARSKSFRRPHRT